MNDVSFFYNHHYIRINSASCITEGWSDGPHSTRIPTKEDILINDQGGYQFKLIVDEQQTEENPALYTLDFLPLYKWENNKVIKRTEQEIEADRAASERRKYTADRPYAVGEYLTVDGVLYRATLPIMPGGYITPGTNCVETTMEKEIANLNKEETA